MRLMFKVLVFWSEVHSLWIPWEYAKEVLVLHYK